MRTRCICLPLFTALLAAAQQAPQPAKPQTIRPEDLGTIEGNVVDSSTGDPVGKAMVTLGNSGNRSNPLPILAITKADGTFVFRGLEPGEYRLSAQRNGFVPATYGSRAPASPGTALKVQKGQTLGGLQIKLVRHAVITGRVVDVDGEPMVHANVQLYRQRLGKWTPSAGQASTNDLGEYRLFGVGPGKYVVSASGPRMMDFARSGTAPSPEGENTPAVTFYPGVSEEEQAGIVNVVAGGSVQGIDIRLMTAKTYRISGSVTGARAAFHSTVMVSLGSRNSGGLRHRDTWSGGDGKFELRNVRPGSYTISVESFDGENRTFGRTEVEVANSNLDGVTVSLQPGFDAPGAVRAEDGGKDVKLEGIMVSVFEYDSIGRFGGTNGRVHSDGSFKIARLYPGQYEFQIAPLPDGYYVKSIRVGEVEALNAPAVLSPTTKIDVTLATGTSTLSGTISDEKDAVNTAATVVLIPANSSLKSIPRSRSTAAAQDGTYQLTNIPPGDYLLFAAEGWEYGADRSAEFLKRMEKHTQKITLRPGATETRNLKAAPAEQ